jgi:hypothetical protein
MLKSLSTALILRAIGAVAFGIVVTHGNAA